MSQHRRRRLRRVRCSTAEHVRIVDALIDNKSIKFNMSVMRAYEFDLNMLKPGTRLKVNDADVLITKCVVNEETQILTVTVKYTTPPPVDFAVIELTSV